MANTSIFNAFERMWQHVLVAISQKSDEDLSEINTTLGYIDTDLNAIFENLETLNTNVDGVMGEVGDLIERVNGLENGGGSGSATSYLYLPPTLDNLDYANAILIGEVEYDELCDTNGSGNITIADIDNMEAAMHDASTMANWTNATPSEVTVVATEGGLVASGFNMWGAFVERHITF